MGDAFLIEGNYNLEKIVEDIKEDSYKVKDSNLIDITLKDGFYYGHAKEWNFFLINNWTIMNLKYKKVLSWHLWSMINIFHHFSK